MYLLLSDCQWVPVLFVSGACAESLWGLWFGSHCCSLRGNAIALGSIPLKLLYTDVNVAAPFVHLPRILPETLLASLWSASFPCMCQSTFGSISQVSGFGRQWLWSRTEWGSAYCIGRWMRCLSLAGRGRYSLCIIRHPHFLGLEAHYKKQPTTLYKCVSFAPPCSVCASCSSGNSNSVSILAPITVSMNSCLSYLRVISSADKIIC